MKKLTWIFTILIGIGVIYVSLPNNPGQVETKKVVIATLLSHPALDQIPENIKKELTSRGYLEGEQVEYIMKNANGDMQLVSSIANDIKMLNPDVVVGITTPIAQAISKVWRGPFVFSAVTDPVGAGIMPDWETGNGQITGVSDMWPYKEQLQLMKDILPEIKTVGILFNPGDAASQFGIAHIRKLLTEMEINYVEGPCASTNDVATVARMLIDKVDAIYLSSDATVISGAPGAAKVCIRANKPLIVGDSGTVEKGGLATVSVGYAGVGKETGVLVHRILSGESNIPTVIARGNEIYLNTKAAELMEVTIPPALIEKATQVFTEIK